jgi:tetratricopeptide (TPR) repeat protein
LVWWPWAAAALSLFLVFEAYGPSLRGPFILDDLYLLFDNPSAAPLTFTQWIRGLRPTLMASFWVNYQSARSDPYVYHVTNVFLHFLGSVVVTLIVARLLELAGVTGKEKPVLSVFAGGLFLLHPLQTESVAYVASRSETLSVLFYMSAFAVFLYRRTESTTILRAAAILVLFAGAITTKEHTLTLAVLLVLADWFWGLGGIRKNAMLYGALALGAAAGAWFVWRVLTSANTAGFGMSDLSPATYFFTQCRVLWMYVRLFFLPFGQNLDPDIALSTNPLEHGAIVGLLALLALVAAGWIYRKRFPLAAFGVLTFLLLIAPTSSIVPIRDVFAERRLYLPFLGLLLVTVEILRRLKMQQIIGVSLVVLATCTVLTYRRSAIWGDVLLLWQDTAAKSPTKWRPRFQLAHAYYSAGQCPQAAENYEHASKLGPTDVPLLVDWGLALECSGRPYEGITKLREAAAMEHSAHIFSQIGMIYGKLGKLPEALEALKEAERTDPGFDVTYLYRGNVYEVSGDRAAAAREYQHALSLNSENQAARESLIRVSR